jgi:hypothetical protein
MPETPASSVDIAWKQHTALLDTTLKRIIRYARQMQEDLGKGEINLAHLDALGHATLTTIKQASVIADRVETAARERAA